LPSGPLFFIRLLRHPPSSASFLRSLNCVPPSFFYGSFIPWQLFCVPRSFLFGLRAPQIRLSTCCAPQVLFSTFRRWICVYVLFIVLEDTPISPLDRGSFASRGWVLPHSPCGRLSSFSLIDQHYPVATFPAPFVFPFSYMRVLFDCLGPLVI